MPVKLAEENDGRVLVVHVTGILTPGDYELFVPKLDFLMVRHGKVSVLFELHEFLGWKVGAFWGETKYAIRHFRDVERIAFVGDKAGQKGMKLFCEPFVNAEIRWFGSNEADEAHAWLREQPAEVARDASGESWKHE